MQKNTLLLQMAAHSRRLMINVLSHCVHILAIFARHRWKIGHFSYVTLYLFLHHRIDSLDSVHCREGVQKRRWGKFHPTLVNPSTVPKKRATRSFDWISTFSTRSFGYVYLLKTHRFVSIVL